MRQDRLIKLTVPVTAPHSSTIVEECVSLLRILHGLRGWHALLNNFIQTNILKLVENPFHKPVRISHPSI